MVSCNIIYLRLYTKLIITSFLSIINTLPPKYFTLNFNCVNFNVGKVFQSCCIKYKLYYQLEIMTGVNHN